MAHLSGKSGAVTLAGGEETGIRAWSVDYTVEALEVTDFQDDGVRAYIPGPSGWSGTFEGMKDGAAYAIGSEVALVLKESETANQLFSGQAIITGLHASTPWDGVVSYSYDFQGTAALTVATA